MPSRSSRSIHGRSQEIQHPYSDFRRNDNVHQKQQRAGPMSLWLHWWNAIRRLRPAFSRLQTFLWFATAVAGFTVQAERRPCGDAQIDQPKLHILEVEIVVQA